MASRTDLLQRQAANAGGLSHVYVVTSPADIIAAGGRQTFQIDAANFVVRSSFPVSVVLDGVRVANQNDATPNFRVRRYVREIAFELHGANGGITDSDAYAQHGCCVVEGASGEDLEHILPDPRFLPPRCWEDSTQTFTAGQVLKEWASPIATLFATNGKLPREVWLSAITVQRISVSAPDELPSGNVWRVEVRKEDDPVGDAEVLLNIVPQTQQFYNGTAATFRGSPSFTFPLPLIYLPLAAYAAYGADVPDIRTQVYGSSVGANTFVRVAYNGHYRM